MCSIKGAVAKWNADMLPVRLPSEYGGVITPPIRAVLPLALEISGESTFGGTAQQGTRIVCLHPVNHSDTPQHRMLGEGRA